MRVNELETEFTEGRLVGVVEQAPAWPRKYFRFIQ